jgi:hypothetical protein
MNDSTQAVQSSHVFNHSLSDIRSLYFYPHLDIQLEDKKYGKINVSYYVNFDSPTGKILLQSAVSEIICQSFYFGDICSG